MATVAETLSDYTPERLAQRLGEWGYKPSHAARMLREWYATGGAPDWEALKLPDSLMQRVREAGPERAAEVMTRQVAQDGTTKLLLQLADGRTVESVMMMEYREDRVAGCISSQVGCAMGCDFCATTKDGFVRNLTAGEIVDQFLALRREAAAVGRRVRTLVFMGMGEPMLNLDAVLEAIRRIADNGLGALGWRQITVSTVGIVPGIEAMAAADLNINLAVSLHAPDDVTRARLLPMGRRYGVEEILAAADRYQARTDRPVTIQYCLLRGVNDSAAQAEHLVELLAPRRGYMHVNVLRYNPTGLSLSGVNYETTSDEEAGAFLDKLRAGKLIAHFRRPRGRDIDAACGQLRRKAGV